MRITEKTITAPAASWLFFFLFLEPAAFRHFAWSHRLLQLAHVLLFALVFLFWVVNVRVLRLPRKGSAKKTAGRSLVCLLLSAYYGFLIINTVCHGGSPWSLVIQAAQFLGFLMYLDLILTHRPQGLFDQALSLLTFYLVANFCIICLMPQGLYQTEYFSNNYLLGYDNQNINFILPTMVLVLLKHACYKPCRRQLIATYLVALLTALKIWSGMTLMVVGAMSLVAFFSVQKSGQEGRRLSGQVFNFRNLLITNIIMFVSLVFFRVHYLFEDFITKVLKKDMTLTNRTIIWDRAIDWIKRSPLVGYGKEDTALRAVKMGYKGNSVVGLHAHDRFLEVLYQGGGILLALYLFILFYTARRLHPHRDTAPAKILSFGIFIYMVGMLTEFYDYCILFWGMMVMAEHCADLIGMRK